MQHNLSCKSCKFQDLMRNGFFTSKNLMQHFTKCYKRLKQIKLMLHLAEPMFPILVNGSHLPERKKEDLSFIREMSQMFSLKLASIFTSPRYVKVQKWIYLELFFSIFMTSTTNYYFTKSRTCSPLSICICQYAQQMCMFLLLSEQ